jgi:homoserine kinase
VLAVALDLPLAIYCEERRGGGHAIERRGTAEAMRLDARHDEILRGMHAAATRFRIRLPKDLFILADSRIPPATGLGSHAASYAAGIAIALRLARPQAKQPSADEALDLLVELGGDPPHGSAALLGGFTAVCQRSRPGEPLRFRIVPQRLHPAWHFVVACPDTRISTADSRRILPPTLPHGVAPRSASRLLGLLHALAEGDEDLIEPFLFDEIHVPFRRRLAPGMEEAMAAGREAGAAGVTICGHGPGLVALTTREEACQTIADAMAQAFQRKGQLADTMLLRASAHGALSGLTGSPVAS